MRYFYFRWHQQKWYTKATNKKELLKDLNNLFGLKETDIEEIQEIDEDTYKLGIRREERKQCRD